jgi:hypothetical protein
LRGDSPHPDPLPAKGGEREMIAALSSSSG